MVTVSELSASESQYLRSKWDSEVTEFEKEKTIKKNRLEDRLARQAEDSTAQTVLEESLAHAQAVLAQLTSGGADPAMITRQQSRVDQLVDEVANFSSGASYVSKADAMIVQMELDVLDYEQQLRTTRISEIDAHLGS